MLTDEDLLAAAHGAVVAEVAWRRPDGSVSGSVHTPIVYDDAPTLALTYAELPIAEQLDAAEAVAFVVSDSRRALRGWQPLVASGPRPEVQHDPDGKRFLHQDTLVRQELAKFPPSRLRSDSLLQRRENWWYQARILVRLAGLTPVAGSGARSDPDEGVVVWDAGRHLTADTVRVDDWSAEGLRLDSLAGNRLGTHTATSACLLRHDFSNDLERSATLTLEGALHGGAFEVRQRSGLATLPPVPGVWRRIREAKALERACRRGLAEAGY